MNFITRAVLYTARKWKKTLLLFCLLLAITTLVLSGLAIADVQEEQAEEVRRTTGASFTVSRNTATGGWSSDRGGSYSTQEYLTADKMESIAAINGIEGYNASIRTILCLSDRRGQWLEQILLIAAAAFPLAYLSSKQAAGTLGTLFGKTAEHIIVTSEHFMLVVVVGGVLLVTAVLASCIPAMRLKPKTILSQME